MVPPALLGVIPNAELGVSLSITGYGPPKKLIKNTIEFYSEKSFQCIATLSCTYSPCFLTV